MMRLVLYVLRKVSKTGDSSSKTTSHDKRGALNTSVPVIIVIVLTGGFLFRDVPSSAALPIIRPTLGRQHSMSDRAKTAMQGYLNHFLGNIDIVNSQEVSLSGFSLAFLCFVVFT